MKKIVLMLALAMSLSCLLMACDTAETGETTAAETTAAATVTTEAPTVAETEAPTDPETEASAKVTYTVTVKDQNGDPVEGAAVQMCDDNGCKMPAATDANGVVTFSYDPSNYHITVVECPEGYTCDPEQAFYFEGEATELTVEITKN